MGKKLAVESLGIGVAILYIGRFQINYQGGIGPFNHL